MRDEKLMTRTAAEYNRLKEEVDENIAIKLEEFVHDYLKIIDYDLSKLNTIAVIKSRNMSQFKTFNEKFYHIINRYDAIVMDIYTISRIFIQQKLNNTKQIITFTGHGHTSHYYRFLTKYLGYKSVYVKERDEYTNKCVHNVNAT